MQSVTLQFVHNYGIYNKGDVATFPAQAAKLILEAGAAQAHDVSAPASRPPAEMPERKNNRVIRK